MVSATDVLTDALGRTRDTVHAAVEGCDEDTLAWRADGRANSIAWLVWHLTRVMDDHLAAVAGAEQLWTSAGWAERFRLPFDVGATGYGQSSDEVGRVRAGAELLGAYHDAVQQAATDYLATLADTDLDRVVDEDWDPPVTLSVRLVSVVDDAAQHAGQAGFVRGLADRRS